jgi:hypothetical protein
LIPLLALLGKWAGIQSQLQGDSRLWKTIGSNSSGRYRAFGNDRAILGTLQHPQGIIHRGYDPTRFARDRSEIAFLPTLVLMVYPAHRTISVPYEQIAIDQDWALAKHGQQPTP